MSSIGISSSAMTSSCLSVHGHVSPSVQMQNLRVSRTRGGGVVLSLCIVSMVMLVVDDVQHLSWLGPTGGRRLQSSLRAAEGEASRLWTLEVGCTDHYVWKDKDTFVGIVSDAGEWTLDLDSLRASYDEAVATGSSEVFSAPLGIVKEYVKELQNFGLAVRAVEAPLGTAEGGFARRDFKELSPDLKDQVGEGGEREGEVVDKSAQQIVVINNGHGVLDGSKGSEKRFRAYMELAADVAHVFAPEESILNQCYANIIGGPARAVVLKKLHPEVAQRAVEQLRTSGFEAMAEPMPEAVER